MREIATTWRVYRREFVTVGSATSEADARAYFQPFEGRVEEGSFLVEESLPGRFQAKVLLWNVNSEWKRQGLAEAWMEALVEEGEAMEALRVVERNSRGEVELQNYGKLLLTGGAPA